MATETKQKEIKDKPYDQICANTDLMLNDIEYYPELFLIVIDKVIYCYTRGDLYRILNSYDIPQDVHDIVNGPHNQFNKGKHYPFVKGGPDMKEAYNKQLNKNNWLYRLPALEIFVDNSLRILFEQNVHVMTIQKIDEKAPIFSSYGVSAMHGTSHYDIYQVVPTNIDDYLSTKNLPKYEQKGKNNNLRIPIDGRDGRFYSYYENGSLKSDGIWKNGKPESYMMYDEQGKLIAEKDGNEIKRYNENGELETGFFNENNKKHGEFKTYYKDGTLHIIRYFDQGVPVKQLKEYHPNGQLFNEMFYENGKLNGPYNIYNPHGKLYIQGFYKDGKKDGQYIKYFEDEDKKISEITIFENGKKISIKKFDKFENLVVHQIFDDQENIKEKFEYEYKRLPNSQDKKLFRYRHTIYPDIVHTIEYHINGNKKKEIYDTPVSNETKFYYKNGVVSTNIKKVKNPVSYTITVYSKDGTIKSEVTHYNYEVAKNNSAKIDGANDNMEID